MSENITSLYREISLDVDMKSLIEAIHNTDIGEGSYLNPIPLDAFIINDLDSFFTIIEGVGLGVFMNFKDKEYQPKCHYLKFQNRNKNQENIMTSDDWKKCFDIQEGSDVVYAPDGSLFLLPIIKKETQGFEIISKEDDRLNKDKSSYISYTIVISFVINGKKYYFQFDPLVKISSKHGGVGLC